MSKTKSIDKCIEDFNKVHHNKYDYSKVDYINSSTKVCIICPEHGEFWQTPNKHLMGRGCPICAGNLVKTTEKCIEDFKKIHGDKYDYSKVKYVNNCTKVCIICREHGEFWQTPSAHLLGCKCPKCAIKEAGGKLSKKLTMGKEEFIIKANKVQDNFFSYAKAEYINCHTNIIITCPIHGDFIQTPHSHLQGNGCPMCRRSKLEKEIASFLNSNGIIFEQQKKFEWLGRQSLDFYLPDYNAAIECQGEQHFAPIKHFGGKDKFEYTVLLDKRKHKLCEENGIKLLYYSSGNICENNDNIITDRNKILEIL